METIHILVSVDANYIKPLKTMLFSMACNHKYEHFHIWLLHSKLPDHELEHLAAYCKENNLQFDAVRVDPEVFKKAPAGKRYPQEMYYRLLAPHLLPEELHRVLYLDPDMLIINSLRGLWDLDLGDMTFAAASHTGVINVAGGINHVRLDTSGNYYNTGVILMDLDKARQLVLPDEIFRCVRENKHELVFPDQDIFNHLYGKHTYEIADEVWNYDARKYNNYYLKSSGKINSDWIMANTSVVHFCGTSKPWHKNYRYRIGILYKHYWHKTGN